jgi:hypothetical protein
MMKPILFWLLATVLLTTAPAAEAQQTGKIPRIGFLDNSTASGMAVLLEAFRQELTSSDGLKERISRSSMGLPSIRMSGYLSLPQS